MNNLKNTIYYISWSLLLTCFINIIVAAYGYFISKESYFFNYFTIVSSITIVFALIGTACGDTKKEIDHMSLSRLLVASWLIVTISGAISLYLLASHFPENVEASRLTSWINAWFESVSGYTSCGLTILKNESELPKMLLLWRTLSQWTGGLGVIYLVAIFFDLEKSNSQVLSSELNVKLPEKKVNQAINYIWIVYLIYTVLGYLAFKFIADLDHWEAINYSMTGISTGGFGVDDNSLSDYIKLIHRIMYVLMLLGAASFNEHLRFFSSKFYKVFFNRRILLLLTFIIISALALMKFEKLNLDDGLFQSISAWATAGFNSVKVSKFSNLSLSIMTLAMFIGGLKGSTAGGIKIDRLYSIFRYLKAKFLNENIATELQDDFKQALELSSQFIVILVLAFTLLKVSDPSFKLSVMIFEIQSALSCVGITAGMLSAELSSAGKFIFIMLMYLGRLEISPFLNLFRISAKKI
jgi:trk system potassium uptake protein TrkH